MVGIMTKRKNGLHGASLAVLSLFALNLTLCAGIARADDKLQYAPVEAWVKPVDMPKPDPAQADGAVQFLLENTQMKFGDDGVTTYTEYAIRVQTVAGLQQAHSVVTWNPDFDTAIINKATIIRDGQVIDLLKAGQTYTVARRENNMELSMLDGVLTGVLQPEGLQVGDILDLGMTIRRQDPVFHGAVESLETIQSPAVAIGQLNFRAIWDKTRPIRYRAADDLPAARVTTMATGTDYSITAVNAKSPTAPDEAPPRFSQAGFVEFSQFASWKDISRLMAPLYDTASVVPATSPLKAEIARIRAASSDPKVQAAMALKLVQGNVRYLFLGMNQGGYTPAPADTTWQRRFGDCKGKSALLLALLHDLGIPAQAAMVSTENGDGLDTHLPQLGMFDHVIVRVALAGQVYWLDGTRFGDRDLDSLRVPPFRWALPLSDDGADLEPLKELPYARPATETSIKLDASAGLNLPARAHVETIFRYDGAVGANQSLLAMSAADQDKTLKTYWTGQYSFITPTKVSASYNEATGEETFVMDGDAVMAWSQDDTGDGWQYETDETPVGWGAPLKRDPGVHREAPMVINFPNDYLTREEIDLPKGGKGFTVTGDGFDKTVASTEFHRTVSLKGNVFKLEASKRSLIPEISYADAMKANDSLTKMWSDSVHLVAPLAYRTGAKAPVVSDGDPVTADDFVARGGKHLSANEIDPALADFNQALRLDPANSKALQGRAIIFLSRGKFDASIADCQQAVKADPTSFTAYNCLGQAYAAKGQNKEAIDALTQALAIYPNNIWGLQSRAAAYGASGDKDKARADAQSALDLDPTASWALSIMARLDMMDGKSDDAMALVDKALALDPDNLALIRVKIGVIETCRNLSTDDCYARKVAAVPLYSQIIAKQPSAYDYAMRAQDRSAADRMATLGDLDTAMKLNPKDTIPLMVRAAIYIRDKDWDKALTDVNAALVINPKDEQALSIRAKVYIQLKRVEEAMADDDAVLAMHPDDAEYLNNACWARAISNVQLDKALELCAAALKAAPDTAHILDSRAFVELRLGQYDAAITDYDAVLAKEPKLSASLYGRGIAKLRKGMKAEGNADLTAARTVFATIDDTFKEYGVTP